MRRFVGILGLLLGAVACTATGVSYGPAISLQPTDGDQIEGTWTGWLDSTLLAERFKCVATFERIGTNLRYSIDWGSGPARGTIRIVDGVLQLGDGRTTGTLHEADGRRILLLRGRNFSNGAVYTVTLTRNVP
jgi:hypothetical protein